MGCQEGMSEGMSGMSYCLSVPIGQASASLLVSHPHDVGVEQACSSRIRLSALQALGVCTLQGKDHFGATLHQGRRESLLKNLFDPASYLSLIQGLVWKAP